MAVLVLTIVVSLVLVTSFIGLFLYLTKDPHSDPDRDTLLPFQDEGRDLPPSPPTKLTPHD
jgi:hypothetical protein